MRLWALWCLVEALSSLSPGVAEAPGCLLSGCDSELSGAQRGKKADHPKLEEEMAQESRLWKKREFEK